MLSYTRIPPGHLAQISGRCLRHISLPGCRRRTGCRVNKYQMTVSPRPKSSVRPLADRKPRPTASFVPATVLFYSIRYSQQCFTHHEQITVRVHQGHLILNLKSDTGFPFYRRQNAESTMTSKSMQPVSKAVYGKMSSISLSAPHLTDSVN